MFNLKLIHFLKWSHILYLIVQYIGKTSKVVVRLQSYIKKTKKQTIEQRNKNTSYHGTIWSYHAMIRLFQDMLALTYPLRKLLTIV